MGNKNSRMDAGVGALVGQQPGTTLRRDSEGVVTFLAPTSFLHPGSRDRLAEVGSVKGGSLQSPSSQQMGSATAATKTGHTTSVHGTPTARLQQKQHQRIRSMGPGATAGGQEGTTVRPSPVSARRASALVDAAMNAGRIDAAAMQGNTTSGNTVESQQHREEEAYQPNTVLSSELRAQVKKLGKVLARSMSKREKNSVNATEKSGDKANMRANGTSKNNKHSTDNSGYAVSGQAKEDDRRTGDGDEKRKRDGSNYNTNINSRQKLAVTRSTNTIQSISVKASSLRAVQSNGTAPERDSGDAGLDVNKQAVHGVRENLAPTPSGGVGAGHNITPAAESIGSGVVEEEDEDEVYTTALKGATLSASGCDDQKTTTQPLKGQTTTAVTPLEALISHADTSMSKKASVDSGLYMEESQDTLPSLKQTKPKYGKTKHLPISNHHITAQQKTGTSRERELPLRKTQSSLGLATGIMHISDRVPTSYDKKAKSFYAQSEPGLSSAKIAPSTKNRERRKSERTSTKNSHKVSHARRRLTDDSGPAQARRRTMTRSNSCSTLFVEQTVSNPDLDNILRCMAIAFHLQFLRLQREVNRPRTSATVALRQPASNMNDSSDALFLDSQSKRSTAKHVSTARGKPSSHKHSREATHSRVRSGGFDSLGPQRFDAHVALPEFPSEFDEMKHPLTSRRVPSIYSKVIPSASDTYDFLRALFSAALLKSEVAIVSMVYISRLSDQGGVALQPANWKRVLLGACMLASKVWDDQAVWNTDFCDVLPDVAVTDMNALERVVLEKLAYDVSVTPAQYVEHYLALRDYGVAADLHDGRDLPALTTGNNDFLSRPSSREFLDDTKKTQLLHTHSSEDLLGDGNAALLEMPIRDWSQSRPV